MFALTSLDCELEATTENGKCISELTESDELPVQQVIEMLTDPKFVHNDVTFLIKSPKPIIPLPTSADSSACTCTQVEFNGIRVLFAARSQVFKCMLFGAMMESNQSQKVVINDMDPDTFRFIRDFVYFQDPQLTPSNVASILQASDKYFIQQLKCICIDYIVKFLLKEKNNYQSFIQVLGKLYLLSMHDVVSSILQHKSIKPLSQSECKIFFECFDPTPLFGGHYIDTSKLTGFLNELISHGNLVSTTSHYTHIFNFCKKWRNSVTYIENVFIPYHLGLLKCSLDTASIDLMNARSAILALTKIDGEDSVWSDILLENGYVQQLIKLQTKLLQKEFKRADFYEKSTLFQVCSALSQTVGNGCCLKPNLMMKLTDAFAKFLFVECPIVFLQTCDGYCKLVHAVSTYNSSADEGARDIDVLSQMDYNGSLAVLLKKLKHTDSVTVRAALSVLKEVVSGGHKQAAQYFISDDSEFLDAVACVLNDWTGRNAEIVNYVCDIMNNIVSRKQAHMEAIIDAGFVPLFIKVVLDTEHHKQTIGAVEVLCNIMVFGSEENKTYMMNVGIIGALQTVMNSYFPMSQCCAKFDLSLMSALNLGTTVITVREFLTGPWVDFSALVPTDSSGIWQNYINRVGASPLKALRLHHLKVQVSAGSLVEMVSEALIHAMVKYFC